MQYTIAPYKNCPPLLENATATGFGTVAKCAPGTKKINFQAVLSGNTGGSVSCQIKLYGSNDPAILTNVNNAALALLNTYNLAGAGLGSEVASDSDIWLTDIPYAFYVAQTTSIVGAGAKANVYPSAN